MVKKTPSPAVYLLAFFLMAGFAFFCGQTLEPNKNSTPPVVEKITSLSTVEIPAAFAVSGQAQHALQVKREFSSSYNGFKAQNFFLTHPFLRILGDCAILSFTTPHDSLKLDMLHTHHFFF